MELTLSRTVLDPNYTQGRLTAAVGGDRIECDTLEPPDRQLTQDMDADEVRKHKVKGLTAIPRGRYLLVVTRSPRFGRWLPLLIGVKGFDGIRIHAGNTVRDTAGCILVGQAADPGCLSESRRTLQQLMNMIRCAEQRGEQMWLTVQGKESLT